MSPEMSRRCASSDLLEALTSEAWQVGRDFRQRVFRCETHGENSVFPVPKNVVKTYREWLHATPSISGATNKLFTKGCDTPTFESLVRKKKTCQ